MSSYFDLQVSQSIPSCNLLHLYICHRDSVLVVFFVSSLPPLSSLPSCLLSSLSSSTSTLSLSLSLSSSTSSLSLPLFHFLTHSQTIFRTDTHTVNTPSSPPLTWLSCVMGPGSDQETKRWQCNFLSRCSLYSECLPSRQLAREDFERLQFELYTIARKVLTINIMASVRVPLPIFLLMRSPS